MNTSHTHVTHTTHTTHHTSASLRALAEEPRLTRLFGVCVALCVALCCLASCVDEESELSLDGVRCTTPEVRERYFSGERPSKLEDLRGVWSLELQRCVFTDELEEEALAEWHQIRSAPFVVRFDEGSSNITFESLNRAPFEGSAMVLNGQGAPLTFDQAPGILRLELPYTVDDEEGEDTLRLELTFEGGAKLFLPDGQSRYTSSHETITGRAYLFDGSQDAQVGLFVLRQHPRALEVAP